MLISYLCTLAQWTDMDVFMCGGTTRMSVRGWGSESVPLALSLPIASAMPWPTSIAATAAQGSRGNLQNRPHGQRLLSSLHDITSSPFQQQSHPKPTNAAGFVLRELWWIPTSWKHADKPTETQSFSFLWTSVETHWALPTACEPVFEKQIKNGVRFNDWDSWRRETEKRN